MKKVLAWAVALALVLSSFTMAFAADAPNSSQFKDADQIHYTEAVDVMVATGVINGYPDGTFGPAKTVKRSEMAKMISVMLEGGDDIGDQFKGACPFKDSKDHWAAGYIAYCASEHIIDGRSADVFDPEAEVTGTEVAKMALTSLGYDSAIQGYTGENWAASVLKDAKKNDLFDGLADDFVPAAPCTREAAAQILFNTLKANMVEYDTSTTVTVGDATVAVSSKIQDVEWPNKKDNEIDKKSGTNDGIKQLYEEVFGKDLIKKNAQEDDSNRPAHQWFINNGKDKVGTYADEADYTFIATDSPTFEKAVKDYDEDLADKFFPDKGKTAEYSVEGIYINGDEGTTINLGDTIELIETSDDVYRVVVTQYVAYQISDVDTDVKDDDAKDGVTAYVTIEGLGTFNDDDIVGYDASSYVEDAVIAIASNKAGDIIDSYAMEKLGSGEVTKVYNKAVALDGTKYDLTEQFKDFGDPLKVENSYTLYDYNGYALASILDEDGSDTLYGVLEAVGEEAGTFDNSDVVKIFTAEGKEVVYNVDMKDFATKYAKADYKNDNASDDILIAYTLNDDGEVDSITPATKTVGTETKGAEMKTNGVLAGTSVSENVVAFWNDGENDDPDYVTYDFSALEDADGIYGVYALNDDQDEIMAILLKAELQKTDDILGFISDVETYSDSDGAKADVTVFIDGKEVVYTTIADYEFALNKNDAVLYKFELNADNELKAVTPADVDYTVTEIADSITGDAVGLKDKTVKEKKNNSLDIGETGKDYQSVTGAAVYFINEDGELEISSYSKIKKGNTVTLYQTDEDSSAWNIVVFQEVAASGDNTEE
jgi:hypothetical protein